MRFFARKNESLKKHEKGADGMDRKEQVLKLFESENSETLILLDPAINQLIFLEQKLEELRKLPFHRISEKNPAIQKLTPVYKEYIGLSQAYTNILKVVNSALGIESDTSESPLRIYMKERLNERKNE